MKNNKNYLYRQIGFTLIEMLVVIAVIGILSAATLTALGPARNKAKDSRIISALKQFAVLAESKYDGDYSEVPVSFNTSAPSTEFDKLAKNVGDILGLTAGATAANPVVVKSSETVPGPLSYAVYETLPSDNTKYYCVDSKGASKIVSANTTAVCP